MGLFRKSSHAHLMLSAAVGALTLGSGAAWAQTQPITVAPQTLASALHDFGSQTGRQIFFRPELAVSKMSPGVAGATDEQLALAEILQGTGLTFRREANAFIIEGASDPQSGSAAGDGAEGTVQALIVTAQKREENIQDVPIAMSAFTQEDLTRSQVTGGPDLMTQVPNFTFTKTNFTGYSIQIRGIGTQAISATTDAAVAVAENNTPFIRNRFFEQEFYDLERVEVLRGPQGTLYGRNATAGVVNIISAKPKFTYDARLSADVGNYNSTRLEGMLNIPLVDDKVALRIAGAWTKRDGYDTNDITGNRIDGRDLWSTRTSLRIAPTDWLNVNLIWEHFQESDDRLRSGKQLCNQDDRDSVGGLTVIAPGKPVWGALYTNIYSQGCIAASLYSPDSFEAPNGWALPYFQALRSVAVPITQDFGAYDSLFQSRDLRAIESTVDPKYRAKDDIVELQWSADIGRGLTLTSETSYLYDTIFSMEDYNRFNTARNAFVEPWCCTRTDFLTPGDHGWVFNDPQIGPADRLVAVDASRAKSSQFSQEFRLSSNFEGPFNFSLGANFLRYDTVDKYYVFINTLTMFAAEGGAFSYAPLWPWQPGVTDNHECFTYGLLPPDPNVVQELQGCQYIDPNPIENVNDLGHNYFLSKNPYKLISYAMFGEAYYNITPDLKLTAGLRWTVDKKESPRIPSMLLVSDSVGSAVMAVERQEWREPTGRLTLDWKPDLSFTDETLLYGSYAHGYKAGGSNPPPAAIVPLVQGSEDAQAKLDESATKPKTFDPEFVNAFEVGAKNTLLDGRLTLNTAAFYYDYKGYQISQIIDRSAVNYNFDSKVWGLELEADWRPLENLRLGFKGGYEKTRIADGERAIDIMDRTGGHSDWVVVRPFPTYPSNCILPAYVFNDGVSNNTFVRYPESVNGFGGPCELAYALNLDPVTWLPYVPNPTVERSAPSFGDNQPITAVNYPGFDPSRDYGNNHGEGFFKELGGHELPNAPRFTATVTTDYTIPLPSNWLMTLHGDFYYQSEAWTRVFNTPGYDKLKAYTNVNFAAIFTNEDSGWKVMAYVKNVLDKDNITGAFLNSDDTGLTTNVFLNEPRLYGLRVTKEWSGGPWWTGANPNHTGPYPLTVEIAGQVQRQDASYSSAVPAVAGSLPAAPQHRDLDWGDGRQVRITYKPDTTWSIIAGVRYGKANSSIPLIHNEGPAGPVRCVAPSTAKYASFCDPEGQFAYATLKTGMIWSDSSAIEREKHTIADFAVGKDVGLGLLGDSHSTVSAGLRYASLESATRGMMHGISNLNLPDAFGKYPSTWDEYRADITAERKFNGVGPMLSWEAAQHLAGSEQTGHVDLDWSVAGGVLFGTQKTAASGTYEKNAFTQKYSSIHDAEYPLTPTPLGIAPRSKSTSVPVLDLSLGLSYEIQRVKVGAGYHWERYYKALDAGFAERKTYDRTFDGPYLKIAVGFGG